MKSTIITIGDEILIGQIVDTNSAWISARLNEIGVSVTSKCSVGDTREAISSTINNALDHSDLVIVTGGLGPTKDDITKRTLAEMFDCNLVRDEATYVFVKQMLESRDIEFNQLNQDQALVPECCIALQNHNGTAPGMWFDRGAKVLVSLPGVPFEMKALLDEQVLPMVKEKFNLSSNIHKTILTFGLAESVLAQTIADWEDDLPSWLHLAYLPNPAGIRLRLSAYEVEQEVAEKEINKQFESLTEIIPDYIIGFNYTSLAEAVAHLLTDSGRTLSVAESCTGGALSSKFTAMAGASVYFKGSVVSYSNEVKHNVLGVSNESLERYGAVSRQVAIEMAEGVRRLCDTDYAISTTGIAGPDGGTAEKPVGTVWMAVSTPKGCFAQKMVYGKLREQNIERSATAAINLLRLTMLGRTEVQTTQGVL